jgi:hypothetical protein
MGLEASLLLAYLGRVSGDQAMTDEGLAAMKSRLPAGDKQEEALYQLLSGVWGAEAPATQTPATPPTPEK